MVSLNPPVCDFGWKAPDFNLLGVDGKHWTLADAAGPKGTVVMFICNHCPYVKSIRERLVADFRELRALGIHAVAISSNDTVNYPDDSYDNMKLIASEYDFPFPYLIDDTQAVAKAYGAVCTPDFFGFNADLELQYRGRFDDARRELNPAPSSRDLFQAMKLVAETGQGPREQIASIGCSIKWLEDAAD
ncbi:thioredoxin family protein [Methylobacillus flagellatus]|uniref:thioredoxin family protein n=1 Tax=Methylobacillus flagellatus TaxID=405 RepID=UPI0010F95292|nr:thioredoxin family protein [Methylobacillus flagellatus]